MVEFKDLKMTLINSVNQRFELRGEARHNRQTIICHYYYVAITCIATDCILHTSQFVEYE